MKRFLAWLVLLAIASTHEVKGQTNFLMDSVALKEYLRVKDLQSCFHKIVELGKSAYDSSDIDALLQLGNHLKHDYGKLSSKERLSLRSAAMRVANFHYKLDGYNTDILQLYLVAHDNVNNKNHLDSLAWFIENELCIIYTIIGDYEKADYFGELLVRSLRKYGMHERLSRFYTNKGRLLKSAYKTEEAIAVFQKGYYYADSIQFIGGMVSNALNLAEVFNENRSLGDPEGYLDIVSRILPAYKEDKSYPEKQISFEIEYGKYLVGSGHLIKGFAHFDSAYLHMREYYANHGRREFSKYFLSLGEAFLSTDSLEVAIKAINHGITSLMPEYGGDDDLVNTKQLFADNSIAELFALKADVFKRKHDVSKNIEFLEKALKCLDLALSVNDVMRDYLVADPSKLIAIRNNKEMVTKSIELLHQLYADLPNEDYFTKARALFNRSKSILYSEKILHAHLTVLLKPAEKDQLKNLQRKLLALYDQKLETNADLTTLNGHILRVYDQIDSLYIPYQSLALKLKEPEDYIEYVVDETNIYGLAEFGEVQQFRRIGDTEKFLKLVARLEEFIALKDLSMDEDILHELYLFLLKPFGDKVPEQIVIIPDGPIGFIPFELLKDDHGNYLIHLATISYAFEYESLYDENGPSASSVDRIYCLSPVYPVRVVKSHQVTRGGLYHLPYAKMEVDTISSLFGKDASISESSKKSDWMENIQKCSVFHYAGHAIISGEHAYLALTASDTISEQLTAMEISLFPQPLDLVVLSACETGLGKLEYGEGIRSLGRSFMEGGTKATVISLWNVNDKSTARIMTSFYKYLKQGHKKDDALRNAKLDYLKNTSTVTQHPFYWAAFIPAGNMESL